MSEEKKRIVLYTDGACSGNPGAGGWGAVLLYGEHKREISGGEAETTNNRMELTAVILEPLPSLTQKHEVTFHKVKGHADNELNNRCDFLARQAILSLAKIPN